MQKYKAEKRLKRKAMNIIPENLHCIGAVGRERATLCRCITEDLLLLISTAKTENCSAPENLKGKILKNMQIVLNAQQRNTKHIPEGTLMSQNKYRKC